MTLNKFLGLLVGCNVYETKIGLKLDQAPILWGSL
jgi:hypothetical protein